MSRNMAQKMTTDSDVYDEDNQEISNFSMENSLQNDRGYRLFLDAQDGQMKAMKYFEDFDQNSIKEPESFMVGELSHWSESPDNINQIELEQDVQSYANELQGLFTVKRLQNQLNGIFEKEPGLKSRPTK